MSIVPDYKYFLSLGLGRPLPPPSWNSSNFMQFFFFFEGFPNNVVSNGITHILWYTTLDNRNERAAANILMIVNNSEEEGV